MNKINSILLVGVGGQGIILVSKILTAGLIAKGYDVKMSEIHGMSQRGGNVSTQIRYGEKVYSPIVGEGEADMIIAFEKVEALRALPFLKKGGKLITDSREIYPMPVLTGAAQYPHDAIETIKAAGIDLTVIEAADLAESLGNINAQNVVMLGALTRTMGLDDVDWKDFLVKYVPAKFKELNLAAYDAGYKMQ